MSHQNYLILPQDRLGHCRLVRNLFGICRKQVKPAYVSKNSNKIIGKAMQKVKLSLIVIGNRLAIRRRPIKFVNW